MAGEQGTPMSDEPPSPPAKIGSGVEEGAAAYPAGDGYDPKCVFCRIARQEEPGTQLLPCESSVTQEDSVRLAALCNLASFNSSLHTSRHHPSHLEKQPAHSVFQKYLTITQQSYISSNFLNAMDYNSSGFGALNFLKPEDLVCFQDIRPGAPHHYLVVPKKHIGNCKTLKKEDLPLVEKMITVGKTVLQQKNVTDLSDVRMGFHWPPFCSIAHLHLHVLAPASQLGFLSRLVYRLNSYWFITADQLIARLQARSATS